MFHKKIDVWDQRKPSASCLCYLFGFIKRSNHEKTLIFLTAEFPYGRGEVFIEHEFPYLAATFDRIHILTNHPLSGPVRATAPHVTVSHFPYELNLWDKILAIKGLFTKEVWKEVQIIRQQYGLRLTRGIWNTLLATWHKAGEIPLPAPAEGEAVWVYSYWCNDMALGAARWKKKYGKGLAFCRAHGWDVYMERSAVGYLPFRTFLAQNLDQLSPISENGKQYLTQKIGHFPNVQVKRLGTPRQITILSAKNENSVFRLVSCSSVIPLKRVHLIIEALAIISTNKKIYWTHAGGGPLFEKMKDLAKQLLQDRAGIEYHLQGRCPMPHYCNFTKPSNPICSSM